MRGLGLGLGLSIFAMSLAAVLGNSAVALNDQSATFTRATSAYDPVSNAIVGAGVRRRKAMSIGGRSFLADLIEGSRTNLLAAGTSEHNNITWTATDTTVSAGVVSPDGVAIADLLTQGSAGTALIAQSFTITASTAYSASTFVKRGNNDWILFQALGANGARAWFNVNTGVVGTSVGVGTGTISNVSMKDHGGGWYRLSISGTTGDAATVITFGTLASTADNVTTRASGGTYYRWGMQAENAAFPSSYISNRNLLLQSQNTGNASWTKTDTTITSNALANPLDGAVNADLATCGVAGTDGLVQAATIVAGSTITMSAYLKRGNNDWQRIVVLSGGANGVRLWVNLGTGAIGTAQVQGTGTYTSSSIVAVGSWYRLTVTGKVDAAATSASFSITSATADLSITRVNNATYNFFGAQMEYGTAATGYWATSTAVGLRAADTLSVSYALSIAAGTVTAVYQPYGWTSDQDGGTSVWRLFQDSTGTNASITRNACNRADAAGAQGVGFTPTPSSATSSVTSMTWDATAVREYNAGALAGSDSAGLTPPYTATTAISIGSSNSNTLQLYGWVVVMAWPFAQTVADESAIFQSTR